MKLIKNICPYSTSAVPQPETVLGKLTEMYFLLPSLLGEEEMHTSNISTLWSLAFQLLDLYWARKRES